MIHAQEYPEAQGCDPALCPGDHVPFPSGDIWPIPGDEDLAAGTCECGAPIEWEPREGWLHVHSVPNLAEALS